MNLLQANAYRDPWARADRLLPANQMAEITGWPGLTIGLSVNK